MAATVRAHAPLPPPRAPAASADATRGRAAAVRRAAAGEEASSLGADGFGADAHGKSGRRRRTAAAAKVKTRTSARATKRDVLLLLGLPACAQLLMGPGTANAAGTIIRPELVPDFTSFDKSDPDLKTVYYMIQDALNAPDVEEEERRWTAVIERYGSSDAAWASDAVGRAYGNRGNTKSRQGRFESAIDDYNRSIALCPYSSDPVLNRGVAYEGLREYKRAIEDYQSVLDVNPSDPSAWNNFGNANAALQNWEVALGAFKKAASMSNSFSFAAVNYATILFQLGRDEEAIREFRKILIKYPSFTDARAALAVALWMAGNRSDAETAWYRVEDSRYSSLTWLEESRHWPPRLVKGMGDFLNFS
mmetsp:Transcript_13022/g.27456  ORF Transcript_13022/g.27456 Transcript_13022/m.27456 type:complete len:363 (-) Transcript_13022:1101-2189(-)